MEQEEYATPVFLVMMDRGYLDAESADEILFEHLMAEDSSESDSDGPPPPPSETSREDPTLKEIDTLIEERQYEKALEQLENLPDSYTQVARTFNQKGIVHAHMKQPEAAIDAHQKAIELDPAYAKAHYDLGLVLHGTRKLDEAIASYLRGIEQTPDHIEALNNLGIACVMNRDLPRAVEYWTRALEIDKERKTILFNMKMLQSKLKSTKPTAGS